MDELHQLGLIMSKTSFISNIHLTGLVEAAC